MSLPLITIITPTLNEVKYLPRTIESVLGQGYPNLEYWIIDGGSSDGSLNLLRSYGNLIHWLSERDSGQSQAINKGLARAGEGIVAWLNANDLYEPGALSTVAAYLDGHPEAGLLFGRGMVCNDSGTSLEDYHAYDSNEMKHLNSIQGGHFQQLLNVDSGWISQPTAFWRTSVMHEVGFLREDLAFGMDYEYWLRCGQVTGIHFVDAILGTFRLHPKAKSTFAYGMWRDVLKVNREYHGRFWSPLHKKFARACVDSVKKRAFPP